MLTNKVFLRKNKRGNVLKIIREHYLRTDLYCGSRFCILCPHEKHDLILSEDPKTISSIFNEPHYLLLDTNAILNDIDIFEEDVLNNVIIVQSVIDEVKHKSSAIYKRLRNILNNPGRQFYTFVNEHHRDTYIERLPKESSNDRNDRAIRKAAIWYQNHLNKSQKEHCKPKVHIVFLTDDKDNRRKAQEEGIISYSVGEYVRSLTEAPFLQDKLSIKEYASESNKHPVYPAHLTLTQMHDGIKNGKLFQGSFLASRENFLEANVNVECFEKFVLVQGRESLNRAIDGDTVCIEILPESEWSSPSQVILEDNLNDPIAEGDEEQDEEDVKFLKQSADQKENKQPTGRIVGIIKRKWRQYCGIIQPNEMQGSVRHIFVPAERKIPRVRIETRQAEKLYGQRIIVAIDQWPRHSRYPQGHFIRILGPLGDKDTENEVLLIEHDVPHSKFSQEVLNCLPGIPWIITEQDYKERVDLRNITICSVDPPGCTDIDDALHSRALPNGNIEVGVHIADVSHFIRPSTALDKEAASRATTVYLVDKRIDMVPELLSSNLCSLRGNVERFAFSCIWEMDKLGNIKNTKFHKSVIKSKAALTYEEAQLIIDDKNKNDDIAKSLRQLNGLAKILKCKRTEKGALVLASPEIRFHIDSETNDPIEVQAKQLRETNSMVEEFMLLANISVAEKIEKEFPEHAMLRRHPSPPQTNFDPLIKAVQHQGFDIDTSSGKALADSLDQIEKEDNPYFNTMLRILATRCMMQAVYFISGTLTRPEFSHYGLAAPIYTHFTSPIRRYADVIVHRLLAACIGADSTYSDLLDKTRNSLLCNNLNYRNRMAQYAGRASVALNTHLFFRNRTEEVDGYVLFVRKNALQILVLKYGLEGTIYLSSKNQNNSKFIYNEENQTQQCGDVIFHSFDPVIVRLGLDSTNVQHEKLVFELIKPYIDGFSISSSQQKADHEQTSSKRKSKDNSNIGKKSMKKKKN